MKERSIRGKVYLITNKVTNIQYVGLTKHSIENRFKLHLKAAKRGRGSINSLAEAIRQFGSENFAIELIDTAQSDKELQEKEIYWIHKLNTLIPYGYNQNRGGVLPIPGGEYIVEGKKYFSLAELATQYGILEITLHKRMQSGLWTLEQSLELQPPPVHEFEGKKIVFKDKEYISITQLCKEYQIDKRVFDMRVNKLNWTMEEALEIEKRSPAIIVDGKNFNSLTDACKTYDKNYKKIESRLRLGWTPDEAFDIVSRISKQAKKPIQKITEIFYEDKNWTITELAKRYNLKIGTLSYRLRKGYTIQQALGLDKLPQNNSKILRYIINGIEFENKKAMCSYFNIPEATFRHRVSKFNWTVEEALNIKNKKQAYKKYVVTDPQGQIHYVDHFRQFANIMQLPRNGDGLLKVIYTDKLHSYKGWIIRYANDDEISTCFVNSSK